MTTGDWLNGAQGFHKDYSDDDGFALIDMAKLICPQLVIVQTRSEGHFDRFKGFQIHMDSSIPQLVASQGFVSSTIQHCGTLTWTGSLPNQLFYLKCKTRVCGRYLDIQFGGSAAVISRIGVFAYPV